MTINFRIPWWAVGATGTCLSLICPLVMMLTKSGGVGVLLWMGCLMGNLLTAAAANGIASEANSRDNRG